MMKMKTKIMLTSIIFMLLALPLEAKEVYIAVLHDGIVPEDQRHWDDLDAIIKANSNNIDHYFQAGDYTLDADREFIIRGGRSSIAVELEKYKTRNIITDKYHATTKLHAYGCYVKRPIGTDNTTYIIIRPDHRNTAKASWRFCHTRLNLGRQEEYNRIRLKRVITALDQLY